MRSPKAMSVGEQRFGAGSSGDEHGPKAPCSVCRPVGKVEWHPRKRDETRIRARTAEDVLRGPIEGEGEARMSRTLMLTEACAGCPR